MLNLAWGGFANGGAALKGVCVQAVGGIPGDLLEPTTAAAWSKWRTLVHQDTGVWLYLDHSDIIAPGFRDIPNQGLAWDRYQRQGAPVASHPPDATHQGSNHGWGRAFDVTGFEGRPAVWNSMNARAAECGLSNATGSASGERWHWECVLPPTTTASYGSTLLEDDLPDMNTFLNTPAYTGGPTISEILKRQDSVFHGVFDGGSSMKDQGKSISQSLAEINGAVRQPVLRDGKKVTQIQDNADTNTMVRALTAQIGALGSVIQTMATGQGVNVDAITAAAKLGAQQALATLTLKAVS